MGYYSSLLNRKFKDVVGQRYDEIMKDYKEFFISEEEYLETEINRILFPLDISVKRIPESMYDLLELYNGEITLVYITDSYICSVIEEVLGRDTAENYCTVKESMGEEILNDVTRNLENKELIVKKRMFSGNKWDDIERISEEFDMVAISKDYGGGRADDNEISPVAQRLVQLLKVNTVLF
ncbi:universal stress protein [Methanoplanus endosymbiosus]|uniref:Uncharacterized protein n=1 Tax=Methanoplanus endosymbiosus TaxID=33865 RepID=A0A9E7PLX1_9EURY|nr:hypothetical protein [Methanoplanus endosymbiosus]UUX91757.1 hypothetical protein L6E24_10335 [Methanoplanus endosymbiosus]